MASITPNPRKRGCELPPGCKGLIDVLNLANNETVPERLRSPRVRVNGKIRAREVRVVSIDGKNLGVMLIANAIALARSQGADLVEIAPKAHPPICRIIDYGQFCYEQSQKSIPGN